MFNFDVHGLREIRDNLLTLNQRVQNKIGRKATREGSNHIRRLIREEAPKRTGALRRSVRVKVDRIQGNKGFIGSIYVGREAWYARMVEFGVHPYKIDPVTKKALKFGGVFASSIDHPGIRANPFMQRAAQRSRQEVINTVKVSLMAGIVRYRT